MPDNLCSDTLEAHQNPPMMTFESWGSTEVCAFPTCIPIIIIVRVGTATTKGRAHAAPRSAVLITYWSGTTRCVPDHPYNSGSGTRSPSRT
jgi:hypothetical protein